MFHLDVKKGQGCIVKCRGEKGVGRYKKKWAECNKGAEFNKGNAREDLVRARLINVNLFKENVA